MRIFNLTIRLAIELIAPLTTKRVTFLSNSEFATGQRWISNTEADLGLGIVVNVVSRRVDLTFPAAAEQRTYATDNAPLGRVIYPVGDRVRTADGRQFTITDSSTRDGCVLYAGLDDLGESLLLHEIDLDSFVRFSKPKDRLFAGQVDKPNRFKLRCETLKHRHRIRRSPVHGLLGPRVQLLPHQLYIASQVAQRHAPRVLLADEVGLGKTIEAGLIIHQQLITGRADRVLIVVPDSLVHQWLVEMLRRFNLRFTILDKARCIALEQREDQLVDEALFATECDESDGEDLSVEVETYAGDGAIDDAHTGLENNAQSLHRTAPLPGDNPFESAQLVLCSLSFLVNNPSRLAQAQAAPWDMLVVDEAHHLQWSETEVSPAYRCIETLARHIGGLLLLTATPEQLGVDGHFARLRLLDSDRYYNLQKFVEEEAGYHQVSELVTALLDANLPTEQAGRDALVSQVTRYLGEVTGQQLILAFQQDAQDAEQNDKGAFASGAATAAAADIIQRLLDRHGTGRVLFRNTRDAVAGFPKRILHAYTLTAPAGAARGGSDHAPGPDEPADMANLLRPEQRLGALWLAEDARVSWLVEWLADNREHKALVICANARTARELEEFLRLRQGVRSAVFHEGMNLIARDRAAAYFADEDDAAQVLVCSEIGSEGRNFQFAQHLVLFDLPLNPDLLEQRIGRLDRIGQKKDVHIHVPCHQHSAQTVLLRWYHEGLNAFERVCPVGTAVYSQVAERLHYVLCHSEDTKACDELIDTTSKLTGQALATLQEGRDRLLELNSCDRPRAEAVVVALETLGQGHEVAEYLDRVFDEFGIEHHYHSTDSIVVEPGDQMSHAVAGLPEDGLTATFSRQRALGREDMQFFTWEHPLVAGIMDTIADGDFGSTTICSIKLPQLKPGTLLLEAVFTLRCLAPRALQVQRYLPESLVRVVVDQQGRDLSLTLTEEHLAILCKPVKKNIASEMVRHIRSQVSEQVAHAEQLALKQQADIVATAGQRASEILGGELQRLQALAEVNANIRTTEIDYLRDAMASLHGYLANAELSMDAMRVVVVAP